MDHLQQQRLIDTLLARLRRIQGADHRLFDLRPGKALTGRRQCRQIKLRRLQLAALQVDGEDLGAHLGIRQIDKEQLVETPLAHQLRRQTVDGIGGGHQKHRRLALGHPGQQGAQHPLADPTILITTGQALLDLIHPQHAGRHALRQLQGLAQVALGLAEELVVQAGEIQAQQRQPPQPGHRLGRQAFAAALHTHQQHPLGQVFGLGGVEHRLALTQPALEGAQAADLGETRGVVLEAQHALQIQQLELALVQLRQIILGDCAVIADHPPRQGAGFGVAHAAQVFHHLLQGAVIGAHPRAAIALAPARGLIADDGQ